MRSKKHLLLSTSMIPLIVFGGVVAGGMILTSQPAAPPAHAACNPCNPCAAGNPCNPCAAAAACNPCAAANPCNPCAAADPCNPCAAADPCNPCAAGGGTTVAACAVPRLQSAAVNPCAAAKPCNPCNPCAAASPCNPCNPCAAANPCNPCNPCAAGGAAEITDAEAVTAYDCLFPTMTAAYAKSDAADAADYANWRRYSTQAYVSATHGSRYVQNYANPTAKAYGSYEDAGAFPPGAKLAKDSFMVNGKGEVSVGPLFMMEKMPVGFNPDSDDWRYTMIMPNGAVAGTTNGEGTANVEFCIGCHMSVSPEQDSVMLMPEEYRVK